MPTTFFQNNAVDFGALSGTSLTLDISLSITESAAGGYDFGMLIGDPPPAPPPSEAAAHHNMVAAISSFGAGGDNSSGTSAHGDRDDRWNPLAAHPA
jgi:hypothetical protein